MCKQSTKRFRIQIITINQTGRTTAIKLFIRIFIILTTSKSHNLSSNICTKFYLTSRIFNHNIIASLIFLKCNKLQRHNVSSLMQKLIERMLTICSRFTKNYRTSNIINLFTKTVYRFSVTFHIKLLQMSRKTTQSLRIRQNCSSRIFLNISFINTNQSIHQSRILCDILIQRKLIFLCSTIQKFLKNLWTKSKTQNSPANTRSRRITTTNIIIHVESSHIIRIVSQRRSFRSNSNHVFRSITTSFFNKFLNKRFISQSFKRSTRF